MSYYARAKFAADILEFDPVTTQNQLGHQVGIELNLTKIGFGLIFANTSKKHQFLMMFFFKKVNNIKKNLGLKSPKVYRVRSELSM